MMPDPTSSRQFLYPQITLEKRAMATEELTEETVRAAEHLLRTGNLEGLVLLPAGPSPQNSPGYSWEVLVADARKVHEREGRVQAVVRSPATAPSSGAWAICLFGEYLPSGHGFQDWQRQWLESPFDVPMESEI